MSLVNLLWQPVNLCIFGCDWNFTSPCVCCLTTSFGRSNLTVHLYTAFAIYVNHYY